MAGQPPHGAAATPPVSTPSFPHAAAFSPRGPRSSPQAFKKSPATVTSGTTGHPTTAPVNFDSPSTAAAFGGLNISGGLDLNLDHVHLAAVVGNMGKSNEDERAKRLEDVIACVSSKGVVSEAGLERLVKKLGLECIWENDMGEESRRTLIVAGSALELLIHVTNNKVQSVSLSFPESGEVVNEHAPQAGQILLDDLKLREGQSPLTRKADGFVANFERLAILDRLSTIPGLNLYQAIAGIFVGLNRLHQSEMQKLREDPALTGKSEDYLKSLALCTRSGIPHMDEAKVVGLTLDYWKEHRLLPPTGQEKVWRLLISCGPLSVLGVRPVRVSDNWLPIEVEKSGLPNWQEPEDTFIPAQDESILGPTLPNVAFTATFEPPIHVSLNVWEQIRQLGCAARVELPAKTFDSLLFPLKPGEPYNPESRVITQTQKVPFTPRGETKWMLNNHVHSLYVYQRSYGATLNEMSFSHPREFTSILPWLRQYAFLAILLENSFGDNPNPLNHPLSKEDPSTSSQTSSNRDEHASFMAEAAANSGALSPDVQIDVTLLMHANPQLQIVFPFRDESATVVVEIRENGLVHIESQNVLDARNATAPDGRQRRPEDLGKLLETVEHIGKWVDFVRTRWA